MSIRGKRRFALVCAVIGLGIAASVATGASAPDPWRNADRVIGGGAIVAHPTSFTF